MRSPHPASDHARNLDIMRQGCMKRMLDKSGSLKARILTIKNALSGKSGYQSPWAIALLKEELASLEK